MDIPVQPQSLTVLPEKWWLEWEGNFSGAKLREGIYLQIIHSGSIQAIYRQQLQNNLENGETSKPWHSKPRAGTWYDMYLDVPGRKLGSMVSKWVIAYLFLNGLYWGYNLLTNL